MSFAPGNKTAFSEQEAAWMARAVELAERGLGTAEPNPLVGCVVVRDDQVVGEGWHQRYGGPHAEVHALRAAGNLARGSSLYVTLEPCAHHGKTPPCTQAILAAGIRRVVAAQPDPFPQVAGRGFAQLQAAGVIVETGLLQSTAERLNAPYLKMVRQQQPWLIAKWALTLDGHIATTTGDSQWISSPESRAIVHALRGRMDAILVGSGTALRDNPQLTARPAGPRTALRVVVDSQATLPLTHHLVQTARDIPVLVAVSSTASPANCEQLAAAGCEVWPAAGTNHHERLASLLSELGRRRCTNVLVEGGSQLLGLCFDLQAVDEVHVFIAPKICGGATAPAGVAGRGVELMARAWQIEEPLQRTIGPDVYVSGRVHKPS